MTDRLLRAIEHPHVDIPAMRPGASCCAARPTRWTWTVADAAARHGVAIEINRQVDRWTSTTHAKLARDRGASLIISTDAHSKSAFGRLRWGVMVARRAWLQPADVLNTQGFDDFRSSLRRKRRATP